MRPQHGLVDVARLDCRLSPYDWVFAGDQAARVDAHWAVQRQAKPALFDGRVLLAHAVDVDTDLDGDTLRARYFETGFKSFLGWRDFGFPGAPVANCFAMAALRAADSTFLLGEMSGGTANAGKLYFPSGTPDSTDIVDDDRIDLEASIVRELEEETGLTPADVTMDDGWTIVFEGTAVVACMKSVRSTETVAALQKRLAAFNATQADPELSRLVPVASRADYDRQRMPAFMLRYLDAALSNT